MATHSNRRRLLVLSATAVVLNAATFAGLSALFPHMSWTSATTKAATTAAPTTVTPVAQPLAATPAQDALTETLDGVRVADLPGAGWAADEPTIAVDGAPFGALCSLAMPPRMAPAFSRGRTYVNATATADVRLWAFAAGQGAEAFRRFSNGVDGSCAVHGVHRTHSGDVGVESLEVQIPVSGARITWVLWREGDVLGNIVWTSKRYSSQVTPDAVAGVIDTKLQHALAGRCRSLADDAAQAARNPFSVVGYKPYTTPLLVQAPWLTGDVTAPQQPAVTAPQSSPNAQQPQTYDLTLVAEQADPSLVMPPAQYVTTPPSAPTEPQQPPTEMTTHVKTADPAGPGCGWSFTAVASPVFHQAVADADRAQQVSNAQQQITAQTQNYYNALSIYQGDQLTYEQNQVLYQSYLNYQEALRVAQAAYDEKQRQLQPSPTPTPTSSAVPDPEVDPDMNPTPSADPSSGPSPSGSPSSPTSKPAKPVTSPMTSPITSPQASPTVTVGHRPRVR